jgi:hypothetical protein
MLTTYQSSIIGYLYKKSFLSAKEINKRYGINLFNDIREIGENIELAFALPNFLQDWQEHSSLKIDKNIPSNYPKSQKSLLIIRKMIEIVKISTKKIQLTENPYNESNKLYTLINNILPEQFNFHYKDIVDAYPYSIDLKDYLHTSGLIEVTIENDKIWVYPKNYNEKEELALSSLYLGEVEGLYYIGGIYALNKAIGFIKMDLQEIEDFYNGLNNNK